MASPEPTNVSYAAVRAWRKFELLEACDEATELLGLYIKNGIKYHCIPISVRNSTDCPGWQDLHAYYNADVNGGLLAFVADTMEAVLERLDETAEALKAGDVDEAEQTMYFAEDALDRFTMLVRGLGFYVLETVAKANADFERGVVGATDPLAGAREEMFRDWAQALVDFSQSVPDIEM